MSRTTVLPVTRRATIVGAAVVLAVVALSGCAGTSGKVPEARQSQSQSQSSPPSAERTPSPAPTRATDAAAATTDLTFEDGAALPATTLPAFGLEVSALDDWEQTGEDSSVGSREYTKSDGSVATITQQRITDLDPSMGDRAATEQLFTAAGMPGDQLEEQLLPTMTGGTAQFLSIAGHTTDGSWSATVARAFAKPGAALIVKVQTPTHEGLRPAVHDILVHAQVVLT
ncbi:hypothetical protein [Curtobacterium sp. SL109]|uniref:hypothetical protein n=1 Tax=Curtobacterium sp. SL109 TaxID=2994662 RepID=UPI002273998D|nr:hypothetical protein [Curtobacterium sp. SL109]MCY1695253.1 hypothetical protein [Curtobacterium sp. SL109]